MFESQPWKNQGNGCCCCCRPHSTNVLSAESSTRNHVAASSLSPQVARKGSTLSGFVQRSRLEREVGRDLPLPITITKVMVSSGVTKDGMSKSKVDPCGVCSLRVKANSIMCLQCGKWIHSRCARMKMVTPKLSRNFACRKCEGNIGEAVEQEKSYVMKWKM